MIARLPDGFEELSDFVDDWALADAAARDTLRGSTPTGRRQSFHDALAPRLEEILDFLDSKPLAEHNDRETSLMRLALSFAHIAQAQQVQGPDEDKHAKSRKRLPITRAPADL